MVKITSARQYCIYCRERIENLTQESCAFCLELMDDYYEQVLPRKLQIRDLGRSFFRHLNPEMIGLMQDILFKGPLQDQGITETWIDIHLENRKNKNIHPYQYRMASWLIDYLCWFFQFTPYHQQKGMEDTGQFHIIQHLYEDIEQEVLYPKMKYVTVDDGLPPNFIVNLNNPSSISPATHMAIILLDPIHSAIRRNNNELLSYVRSKGMRWGHFMGIHLTNNPSNLFPYANIKIIIPETLPQKRSYYDASLGRIRSKSVHNEIYFQFSTRFRHFREKIKWSPSDLKILINNNNTGLRILD